MTVVFVPLDSQNLNLLSMKKKALILALFAGIVFATSCADDVLDVCTKCVETSTGDEVEQCGGIVVIEAFESSYEKQGYECTRQ
jgi:hypothetical protein